MHSARREHERGPEPVRGLRLRRLPRRVEIAAVAAALVLAVSGAWLMWRAVGVGRGTADPYDQPWRSMERVYQDRVAAGFRPQIICRDEAEFEGWFERQFGQPLQVAPLPDGSRAVGLGYAHTLSRRTIILLADSDGARIILFIDRLDRSGDPVLPADPDLHVHRGQVGVLVAYEVSPLPEPRILPYLFEPGARRTEGLRSGKEDE